MEEIRSRAFRPILRKAVFALVLMALAMPLVFMAAESHHDCTGDGCAVCRVLAAVGQLEQEGMTPAGRGLEAPRVCFLPALSLVPVILLLGAQTPVSLWDRMDD